MASKRYDHPAYQARYCAQIDCPAGTVNTTAAKFVAFADMKIKSIKGNVVVAGTHDNSALNIYNGTTSIGAFANGTQAAHTSLTTVEPTATTGTMAEGGYLEFRRSATNGATMRTAVAIEYEITGGADLT